MSPADRIKRLLYALFVRHGWFRSLLAAGRRLLDPSFGPLSHFALYRAHAVGPIQPDEAHLLYGLSRVIRPRTIVEFGFHRGQSTLNFLAACPDARLYSFDIDPTAEAIARRHFARFPGFTFVPKSQADFEGGDVGGAPVDLVFLDASHDLALNRATFARLLPHLSPDAVLAIHDTGAWHRSQFREIHHHVVTLPGNRGWLDEDRFLHEADERRFVNWIAENHPEFGQLHLGTERVLRHGLTLIQRRALLPTGPEPR